MYPDEIYTFMGYRTVIKDPRLGFYTAEFSI